MTAGYSATPLPRKLGITAGSRVLLLGAPADLVLAPLPSPVTIHRRAGAGSYDVAALFCPDLRTLEGRFAAAVQALTAAGCLWVCWPKRASGIVTDISENAVRERGLRSGLVDVKVAAIDPIWSGLKFVRRRAER